MDGSGNSMKRMTAITAAGTPRSEPRKPRGAARFWMFSAMLFP